jgi:rhodanese-related sulfurtransferase
MPSPNCISIPQLGRLIGTPESPRIIDVRIDDDFETNQTFIPGSIRHPHTAIASLGTALAGQKVAIVCQKGLKLSQGAAALLRVQGVEAEYLEGGSVAWAEAGKPAVPAAKTPTRDAQGRTLWVTRHRPKIDRIACPWLIRRFVDPDAVFLFVAPSQVLNVADRFDATPFDIEDVTWSHRGDQCTFDTMIEEFELHSEELDRLAVVVRGADTDRHDLAPESAGLLAASLGLSRMYKDDLQQLKAGMMLYDAFFRWSRDAVEESHDWPAASPDRQTAKAAD